MKQLFSKVFKTNKPKRNLTHGERVSVARQKAECALGMFTTAYNELEEVNEELSLVASEATIKAEEIMREAQERQQEYLRHAENANDEITMHKAVQARLKELVTPTNVK